MPRPPRGFAKGAGAPFQRARSDRTVPVGPPRVAVASLMILPPTSCSIAAEGYSRQALAALIVEAGAATCRASRSVVLGRRPENQPLELADGPSAQAQSGLEALLAQLARVEAAAQLVQRAPVLFLDLVARGLDQDDVARPALRGREPHPALALLGVEP